MLVACLAMLAGDQSSRSLQGQPVFPLLPPTLSADPRAVILEIESQEAFRAGYDSPACQAALPLRLESAPGTLIVVDGVDAV